MNTRDWKGAFGPTPESFKQKVSFALKDAKEGKPVKKIRAATVVALALAVILLAAVAYAAAAKWGLFSFLEYRYNLTMPPEAKDALQTNLPQTGGEEAEVIFKVREALYDGTQLHVIIEARPKENEKILLLGFDQIPEDLISNAGPLYEGDSRTFAQVAAEEGKRLVLVNLYVQQNGVHLDGSADCLLEEDGTLAVHLSSSLNAEGASIPLVCGYTVLAWQDDGKEPSGDQMVRGKFSFDLPASNERTQQAFSGPVVIENTGVAVERVILTKTAAGLYAELTFSILPDASEAEKTLARDGLWFEYLDENGVRIESGTSDSGSIEGLLLPDGTRSDTTFVQTESLNLWELPDSVTIRAYDCWEKTRFGQHTFAKDE